MIVLSVNTNTGMFTARIVIEIVPYKLHSGRSKNLESSGVAKEGTDNIPNID